MPKTSLDRAAVAFSNVKPLAEDALALIRGTVGAGPATVARRASQSLGCPICVLDAASQVVTESSGERPRGMGFPGFRQLMPFLADVLASGPKLPTCLAAPEDEIWLGAFPAQDWRGCLLGYVVGAFPGEQAAREGLVVLEAAAIAAAASLSGERFAERTRLELHGDFFERLLSQREYVVDDVMIRAKALGIELCEFFWCCLVDFGDSGLPSPDALAGMRRAAAGELGPLHMGITGGVMYLLVPADGINVRKREALARALSRLVCGIEGGGRCPPVALHAHHSVGVAQVSGSWEELLLTRRAVRLVNGACGVHDVDEFVLPRFLMQGVAGDQSVPFVEKTIGPVLDYDRLNGTRLLRTLEAYLDSGCSLNVAARSTSYHRNTVRRQLERLQALLGASLDDASVRFGLHLAVKIHRLF